MFMDIFLLVSQFSYILSFMREHFHKFLILKCNLASPFKHVKFKSSTKWNELHESYIHTQEPF